MPAPDALLPLTPLWHAILLALADGDRHGYHVRKDVERALGAPGRPGTGTLYTALQRLCEEALIEEVEPPVDEADARRRYYGLTGFGRAVAAAETRRLARLVQSALEKKLVRGTALSPELLS